MEVPAPPRHLITQFLAVPQGDSTVELVISDELQKAWDDYEAVRELRGLENLHRIGTAKLEELAAKIASRRCDLALRGVL